MATSFASLLGYIDDGFTELIYVFIEEKIGVYSIFAYVGK